MSIKAYDLLYQEALQTLRFFGVRVGKPLVAGEARRCPINGRPLDDHTVFLTAWGRERADRIRRARLGRRL